MQDWDDLTLTSTQKIYGFDTQPVSFDLVLVSKGSLGSGAALYPGKLQPFNT